MAFLEHLSVTLKKAVIWLAVIVYLTQAVVVSAYSPSVYSPSIYSSSMAESSYNDVISATDDSMPPNSMPHVSMINAHGQSSDQSEQLSVNSGCHDQQTNLESKSSSHSNCCCDELSCELGQCTANLSILNTAIQIDINRIHEIVYFYLMKSVSSFLPNLFRPPQR